MKRARIEQLDDESLYALSVRGGHAYAQHCFAERLKPRIAALARRWVDTPALAEEVAAEVLRKLMMTGTATDVNSVTALSTIATRNVAMTVLRRRRVRQSRRAATSDYLAREMAAVPPTASELAAEHDDSLEARLRRCISELRPDQQATLRYFYFEDLSYGGDSRAAGHTCRTRALAPTEWTQAAAVLNGARGVRPRALRGSVAIAACPPYSSPNPPLLQLRIVYLPI